jgi:ribonuclease J
MGSHRIFDIQDGDTVVLSAHPIPGNEESVYRTINRLIERGADVVYEAVAPVHVSGHASQEEMKLMLHLTQPDYFIPIHGELRQLKQHGKLARQVGIHEDNIAVVLNGQSVEFQNGRMRLGAKVPASYVYVDGSGVGDVSDAVMHDRDVLSQEGVFVVNLAVDKNTNKPLKPAEIVSRGFIAWNDSQELVNGLRNRINETAVRANGSLQKDLEQVVSSYIYRETRRRPMVLVNVIKA